MTPHDSVRVEFESASAVQVPTGFVNALGSPGVSLFPSCGERARHEIATRASYVTCWVTTLFLTMS